MKTSFFSKTALSNIRKNYRFFVPRILAESGLIAVFFIVFTLKNDERMKELQGGEYLGIFMSIGVAVMTLLSIIIIFYINSFLMKQRKKELGLYNILGMEKRHVGRVLFFESVYCTIVSVISGLAFGTLFYKLCSLFICKLLKSDVVFGIDFIKIINYLFVGGFFILLDVVAYIFNRISIARMKPIELLKSSNTGEKEPKVKWVLLVLGVLCLAGAYYICLTTNNPLQAILLFFLAIMLAIIGTYFLFTAGSIFVLKMLKKNNKYYYNKKHMSSVSGLLYRMKQNAVGLASICVLASGVLVMVSSTVSLYSGAEKVLKNNYPQDYYMSTSYELENSNGSEVSMKSLDFDVVESNLLKAAKEHDLEVSQVFSQKYIKTVNIIQKDIVLPYVASDYTEDDAELLMNSVSYFTYISEDTYISLGGSPLNLNKDEIAICPFNINQSYTSSGITILDKSFIVKEVLLKFPVENRLATVNSYGVVVSDEEVLNLIYNDQVLKGSLDSYEKTYQTSIKFKDRAKIIDIGREFEVDAEKYISEAFPENAINTQIDTDSIWRSRANVYGMYSSLLFLGIILGAVFLFATLLIIYYKQISEGYEDRNRYQIMQKIGMSKTEVKKTINGQVLLVFFLPLIFAGIHLVFASPLMLNILKTIMLPDRSLYIICAIITYVAFALIYTIIYLCTARTYYKIVK